MALMAVCGALLLTGLAAGVVWREWSFSAPAADGHPSVPEVARRFVWYVSLALLCGIAAGITVIGAGGRLAMRLLAVTAGDDAQGRITEADEVVGDITLDGTIGFVLFNGILGGVVAAALYLLVRRFLPPRSVGGLVFGAGLLVVLGTTIDPLRDDNPDFDIVGPGWLSVVVFTGLALAFGVTLAAVTARTSAWLPLLSTERRVLVRYAPSAALAALLFSVTAALVVVGVAVVLLTRWQGLVDAVRSRRTVLLGRLALCGLLLVFLPNALGSLVDIVRSSP